MLTYYILEGVDEHSVPVILAPALMIICLRCSGNGVDEHSVPVTLTPVLMSILSSLLGKLFVGEDCIQVDVEEDLAQ